jgi:hypothetical protein
VRYFCCDRFRRNAVAAHATLNGIDWLEVVDQDAPAGSPRQRTLLVRFLKTLPTLAADNVMIAGGERVRDPKVLWAERADSVPASLASPAERTFFAALPQADHVLVIRTDVYGDFSTYTLSLVRSALDPRAPREFDPMLAAVEFSFKVECRSDFDCKPERICPEPPALAPEINYLAKDYASFRRLILDRITQLLPDWRERNPADLGVALVELLAYVGDHLSYQQDAVATEAYIGTARRRVSIRRHALLVDYFMHDGCNARAWLDVQTRADGVTLDPAATRFCTSVPGLPSRIAPGSREEQAALDAGPEWFELVRSPQPVTFFVDHNEMSFYTWGDERCCLPRGATRATLGGHLPNLPPGRVLVFEEVKGPLTGDRADADPRVRHAVRLTVVRTGDEDGPLVDPLDGTLITEIEWAAEDALPFPLCISSRTDADHGNELVVDVSVARGNVVLVDHGRTVTQDLGSVPAPRLSLAFDADRNHCDQRPREPVPPRFRPALANVPLTQGATLLRTTETSTGRIVERIPFDPDRPATAALAWEMRDVRPSILLRSTLGADALDWSPVRDLLNSAENAPEFVVEVEHDGATALRFGDGEHGLRPRTDTTFTATYRMGNGTAGNVGADSIVHVVTPDGRVTAVRNPLPAAGGRDPETAEEVRRRAPQAFRTQERAVTPQDYEAVTMRHRAVQRAAASLRWTGSWHTVFVSVDTLDGRPLTRELEDELVGHVERFRMAGHDLEFDGPRYVPLEIKLFVCVKPDHFRSDVKARLLEVLGSRVLPDGRRGLFHPDNLSFGQIIYLSPVLAAAHAVPGVASASVVTFQRQGVEERRYVDDGRLPLGRLEIARLDNDPNFPERGVLHVALAGGK